MKKSIVIKAVLIAVAIWLLVRFLKNKNGNTDSTKDDSSTPSSGEASNNSTNSNLTENTVFQATKPYPNNQYVKWIQHLYNKYTRERKTAGKTPNYPLISEDGIYGPETAKAVNRYMGKESTSWKEFRTRIEYYRGQLNTNISTSKSSLSTADIIELYGLTI